MYLPEETQNISIIELWSAFTAKNTDNRTHILPMMDSIAWPIGMQGSIIRPFPGLVNFFPAVAYHFCLNLPAAFSQPWNSLIVEPCISHSNLYEKSSMGDSSRSRNVSGALWDVSQQHWVGAVFAPHRHTTWQDRKMFSRLISSQPFHPGVCYDIKCLYQSDLEWRYG